MPPKGPGGAGTKPAQDYVRAMREQGLSEPAIRSRLRDDGYKPGRISQLLRLTRDAAMLTEARTYNYTVIIWYMRVDKIVVL